MRRALPIPLLVLSLHAGCATTAPSSPDREAVLATVEAFFAAMEARDPAAAERTLLPEGQLVSTRVENGARLRKHRGNREWLDGLAAEKVRLREEFVGQPVVLVDGDVAAVFGAYAFWLDGRPSHTGVDVFSLLRTDEGWRISAGVYSVVRAAAAQGE